MSETKKDDLVTLLIDDQEISVPKGTNVIEAAAQLNVEIPHYCYHPKLSAPGNCRMCLVEMGMPMRDRGTGEPIMDEDGKQKIGWMPRPAIACNTAAAPGMQIKTQSPMVKECQEGVMEFLLINHPLDCPICDQAGECRLQEFATDYGRGYSRFVENKNVKPKRTRLGPRVTLDDERCILCSRCIRFCQEIADDDVLGFVDRGSYSTLTCYPGKELANNYSLNTVDICPVGALTSNDFRFKMRVWFLKETPSICTESSVGVNTEVGSREGKIYRITPRRNDEVNDTWMSDSGRELYKQVEAENRLTAYRAKGEEASPDEALEAGREILQREKTAFVGSGHLSVEEQFLLGKLADLAGAVRTDLVSHIEEGDGLLISADRTPNVRGALLTGLIEELPSQKLSALGEAIDAGEVENLVVYREDVLAAGLTKEQLEKVSILYLGTHQNDTSALADTTLPTLTVFEKSGSFVNQQFRLQRFMPAVPGPQNVGNDLLVLSALINAFPDQEDLSGIDHVWQEMGKGIPAFEDLLFLKIPPEGKPLEVPEKLRNLPYAEGKTLHFEP
ncbi:MAG: (2Fe-2S)-binding protein, partial [Opitutales bacterium]|nr:(2Fe-2S)-binding protein [Opitutales bacterium]